MHAHGLRRLFLHAASLSFRNAEGQQLVASAPIDPALQQVIDRLDHG